MSKETENTIEKELMRKNSYDYRKSKCCFYCKNSDSRRNEFYYYCNKLKYWVFIHHVCLAYMEVKNESKRTVEK